VVRIIRSHHPLYLKNVPLVGFWEGKGERFLVIELPDGSHARVPSWWTDDGDGAPPVVPATTAKLSVAAARELIALLTQLGNRRDTRRP
jgi:hypothetical protein